VKRREFITLLGVAAVAWPLAARAQQPERMRRIGVLMAFEETDAVAQSWIAAMRDGLRKLGWTEGHNIHIDYRWAASNLQTIQQFSKELVLLNPDLIVSSSTPTTRALMQQTRTIPIVFGNLVDPVGSGFAASLSRPGGNITGFINLEPSMAGKWLELLKEIAPRVTRIRHSLQPGDGALSRNLLNAVQECRRVLGCRGRPSSCPRSGGVRNIYCSAGPGAERRHHPGARRFHEYCSCADRIAGEPLPPSRSSFQSDVY
jgi:putative tryptophan/tyrosine transport system substrate-binding protein